MSEETKPAVEGIAQNISIKVKASDGDEVTFKVKPTTKFDKIIGAYAQKRALAADTIRFLFDGHRVNFSDTPESLGMEDGDVSGLNNFWLLIFSNDPAKKINLFILPVIFFCRF